jgi:FKBP-type peptidyl-prolyl cis-trans isomerase FkpA
MKRKLMFLAFAAIGLAGCSGGFKTGPGGLLYNIVDDKSGPSIQPGDFVALNVIVKNDADSIMFNTYDNGLPNMQIYQKSKVKGDAVAALQYLSEGDSAIVKSNIDSLYKGQQRPAAVKGKYQVFIIKIVKVIAKGNLSDQVFQGRAQAYYTQVTTAYKNKLKASEPAKIKKYIDDNKLNMTKTDSGLYYVITAPGTGIKPIMGDTVSVNYTLRLTTGKVVETSIKAEAIKNKLPIDPRNPYKPIRIALGGRGMIQGWNQGMLLLNKGAKATMIIPSSLAYGENGNLGIQPFTPLVFDLELVDITHVDPNAPKPKPFVMPQMPQGVQPGQPQVRR